MILSAWPLPQDTCTATLDYRQHNLVLPWYSLNHLFYLTMWIYYHWTPSRLHPNQAQNFPYIANTVKIPNCHPRPWKRVYHVTCHFPKVLFPHLRMRSICIQQHPQLVRWIWVNQGSHYIFIWKHHLQFHPLFPQHSYSPPALPAASTQWNPTKSNEQFSL